jgi:hypothetical protein
MPAVPADAHALGQRMLRELAVFWENPMRDMFDQRPGRIAGTLLDQSVAGGTENPYWKIIRQLPLAPSLYGGPPRPTNLLIGPEGIWYVGDQYDMSATYSYSICSPGDITWLKRVLAGRPVLELGAGGGYWAWQMRQNGITVRAYDPAPVDILPNRNHYARCAWSEVRLGDAAAAARFPDHVLFMSWPNPEGNGGEWAARALDAYRGDTLVYAGYREACTTQEFYKMLDEDWYCAGEAPDHVSWWLFDDDLTLYRRRQDDTGPALIQSALARI